MHTVSLAAGQHTDLLGLVASTEVERRYVRARVDLALAQVQEVVAATDLVEHGGFWVEGVSTLIDVAKLDRGADGDGTLVGFFSTGDHLEQRGLACAVRPDDADDARRGKAKREVFN